MSLYGNFTLKEWLALHCVTKDIDDLFRKALKDNDEPMAVLALAELIKRGDIDLVTYAIKEAVDAGCFTLGSHFSTVFANALTQCGDRDPILRHISKNVRRKGFWPKTAAELLDGTDFADCERPAKRSTVRRLDDRLDKFLEGFMQSGWFSVEFGFFTPGTEYDPHCHEQVFVNMGEHCNLVIKDGFILNREEIPNVLDILDAAGIKEALPAFSDERQLDLFTLNEDGNWVSSKEAKEDDFFYVTFYSIE
jgi:hypothetical protein